MQLNPESLGVLLPDADELIVCGSLVHRGGKMISGNSLLGKNAPKVPFLMPKPLNGGRIA
jgi:hypothetical protein